MYLFFLDGNETGIEIDVESVTDSGSVIQLDPLKTPLRESIGLSDGKRSVSKGLSLGASLHSVSVPRTFLRNISLQAVDPISLEVTDDIKRAFNINELEVQIIKESIDAIISRLAIEEAKLAKLIEDGDSFYWEISHVPNLSTLRSGFVSTSIDALGDIRGRAMAHFVMGGYWLSRGTSHFVGRNY